ncbi:MAG: Alpha-L-Rha alpha-1,3-L-rhamnosyltransferase (EC [uncultured Sulfurovum sp.]|uniref:Alpha-L-Rha alpha-1,3-L-rhamnosyltransferase (EC) n=1 Tax=uncultured Sulfurovum sp. TaxID=269237 RepID=A0A6S6TMV3_9BACT|nr:MAG: Alpha-L-Rha alpha-1,3-L-rhamnosyltransferase (EC [uncultured Sulfurovum sp.]
MINVKITIILATYNGEKYLEELLNSILNQLYKEFKIVICDDISTDKTLNILEKYQNKHTNKIEIYQNKKQLGVVKNFEKLITLADTEYIALCDQDDVWHENKLLEAIKCLEKKKERNIPLLFHSDLKIVNSQGNIVSNSFFKKRGYAFPKKQCFDVMLGRSGVMGNTMVFNQALKNKVLPFPEKLIVHDYWIALVNELEGERFTYIEPLINYRMHESNTSNSFRHEKQSLSNITLPYHKIHRKSVLEVFKERFHLNPEELIIIDAFMDYLSFKKNKLYLIGLIFRYNFFRLGLKYKLKLIGAMIWKKK